MKKDMNIIGGTYEHNMACRVSDLAYCKYLQGGIADDILEKLIERLTENE